MISRLSDWVTRSKKPITWLYSSAILFPLLFAACAAVIVTSKYHHDSWSREIVGAFTLTFLILMAAVPRSVLPTLALWFLVAYLKPEWDRNKLARYLGLLALMGAVLAAHAALTKTHFNTQWMAIAYLAVILPRLALPLLREDLQNPG